MKFIAEKVFRVLEQVRTEMTCLRKATEELTKQKKKTTDSSMSDRFPFHSEENLREFERSCLNEDFREAIVGFI